MSANCARCGVEMVVVFEPQHQCQSTLECTQRQLSNQAALLRSVTTKLEEAATLLDVMPTPGEVARAREILNGVLEVLS